MKHNNITYNHHIKIYKSFFKLNKKNYEKIVILESTINTIPIQQISGTMNMIYELYKNIAKGLFCV